MQSAQILPDISEYVLPRHAIELNGAACGQMGKIQFNLPVDGETAFSQQCLELVVQPVTFMRPSDKVENRQAIFFRYMAKTATKLLPEDGQAVGWAEKKDGID